MTVQLAAATRVRWAGLAGRPHGDEHRTRPPLVLLHGLTFDRRMWDPVLEALPDDQRAIAFDLPGHGASPALSQRGLAPVVDALHEAVLEAGLDSPILVGHSIAGPIASIYASRFPASAVVSIDAPLRLERFAERLRTLRPRLEGQEFADTWSGFRDSMRIDLLPPPYRALLPDNTSQDLFLRYQADLLERPLDDVLRWRDDGMAALRDARTPCVSLLGKPAALDEEAFLRERLPHAELVVWPVGHHFPHLADPPRFATLLTDLAAVA